MVDRVDLVDLVIHKNSNLTRVFHQWMRPPPIPAARWKPELLRSAPDTNDVKQWLRPLARASCAVVGASSALRGCANLSAICAHDVVIHVNDHPSVLTSCPRADVQMANQHSCYWEEESKKGNYLLKTIK